MLKHINSLVAFTLLSQAAVGLYFFLSLGMLVFPSEIAAFFLHGQIISLVLSLLAMIFSFTHLAYPMHALFALKNLKSSWLSREILFLSIWIILLLADVLVGFSKRNIELLNTLHFTSLGFGILLIWAMSRLYMLRTLPGWRKAHTPLIFFQSALLAGSYIIMMMLVFGFATENKELLFVISGTTVSLLMLLGWLIRRYAPLKKKSRTPGLLLITAYSALLLGWLMLYDEISILHTLAIVLLVLSFLLTAISMIMERKNFYANFEKLGV